MRFIGIVLATSHADLKTLESSLHKENQHCCQQHPETVEVPPGDSGVGHELVHSFLQFRQVLTLDLANLSLGSSRPRVDTATF
jgi:hypothetical protein